MEFSWHEYWSGLPFASPGYLPDPGIEPGSPALQADALPSEPPGNLPEQLSVYIYVFMEMLLFVTVQGSSRQEYWSGLTFPSPGDLPDPGIEPGPPAF